MNKSKRFFSYFLVLVGSMLFSATAFSKTWDPRLLQASELAYQGNYQQAKTAADNYIQENPDDPNGYFMKAVALNWELGLSNQDSQAALKKITQVYKKANHNAFHLWNKDQDNVDRLIDLGNSYLFLGRIYSDTGHWMKAVLTAKKCRKHLEKALKLAPDRMDGLLALGAFHYLAANTPKGAAPFKKLLGIKGSKSQGLAELQKSLQGKHPFRNDTLYILYFFHKNYEKNYPKALSYLAKLESQFPKNPEWQLQKAEVFEKQSPQKGLEGYTAMLTWCESNACPAKFTSLGNYNAGRIAKKLNQNTQAKTYLKRSLNYDFKNARNRQAITLVWLGQLEQKAGNPTGALDQYQKAKKTPKVSKNIKKTIETKIQNLCQTNPVPGKC